MGKGEEGKGAGKRRGKRREGTGNKRRRVEKKGKGG